MRNLIRTVVAATVLAAVLAGAAPPATADPVGFSEQPLNGWDTNGTVYAVAVVGTTAYIGGDFSLVRSPGGSSQTRNNLAAIDMISGNILSFRADTNATVRALTGNSSTIWVGGTFTTIGGQSRQRIASVNAANGTVRSGFNPGASGTVYALELSNGSLYVGGSFQTIGGVGRNRIAKLDQSSGTVDGSFNPNANGTVRGIAIPTSGAPVYASGSFTSIGGIGRAYVSGLNATSGNATGPTFGNLTAPSLDLTITPSGDRLTAAVAGLANRATTWNTTTGSQSWRHIAMGDVQAVEYHAGNIYFGFHEGFQGDTSVRMRVADVYSGQLIDYDPSFDAFWGVWAIDAGSQGLAVGGVFNVVEAIPTRGIAVFQPLGGATDTEPPTTPPLFSMLDVTATTTWLDWGDSTDNIGVTSYSVLRDGFVIATTLDTEYTDIDLLPGVTYEYSVVANDAAANSSLPAGPLLVDTVAPFVGLGSQWSYLDDGSNQGSAWRQLGFDDSSWPTGFAELGFGDGDEMTSLSSGEITYYFRRDFAVTGPLNSDATLLVRRDDGVVVYVNGVEVLRDNMPSGAISHTTSASSSIGGSDEDTYHEFAVPASVFAVGANEIAVEVHQRSAGSSDVSFDLAMYADVAPDVTPPSTPTNLIAGDIQLTSIGLSWDAATDDVAIDNYVVRRNGVPIVTTSATAFTDTALTENTEYTYTIEAVDVAGNPSGESTPLVVSTLSPDATPPSVPGGLAVAATAETSLTLAWNASTDDFGVASYTIRRNGSVVGSVATLSFVDTPLTADTEYSYTVEAIDLSGNPSGETGAVTGRTDPPDVTAPTVPGAPTVTATTYTSVSLLWAGSTDDRAVTGYIVRRNGSPIATVPTPNYVDDSVIDASSYDYTVSAIDAAGNESAESGSTTAVTPTDTTPPSTPGGLTVVATTDSSVTLSWTASTDDYGVLDYTVLRDGSPIATTPATSHVDTGLAASTSYTYTIIANDLRGNPSAASAPLGATTDAEIATLQLIAAGADWRYQDDGSNQGTAWRDPGFDDAAWSTGPAQLGFGDGDEATVIADTNAITYYFRKTIQINGDVVSPVALEVKRDDGVVVWVNGTEVWRSNLPAGTIGHTTTALATIAGSGEQTWHSATIPAGVFVPGANTIAVEIHQRSAGSSDVSFDLSMSGDVALVPPDTSPPTDPANLNVDGVTETTVSLSWSASTDDVAVTGYHVRRDGALVATVTGTSFEDIGLVPGSEYDYTVQAADAGGNTSAEVATVANTVDDTQAPTTPDGLVATATTSSEVSLSWNPAGDNVGVAEYVVYESGGEIARVADASHTVTGLSPLTSYSFTVAAVDAAGNESPPSGSLQVFTTAEVSEVELVAAGSAWKYLDDGSDQGTAWRSGGFDDGLWAAGNAELGFGDGDEATQITDSDAITYYFRKTITINGNVVVDPTLEVVRDDGAVVYVNGTEVWRSNLPGGPIDASTRASTTVAGGAEDAWNTVSIPAGAFVSGSNVIAVEVHQRAASSSDVSFNLRLTADVESIPPDAEAPTTPGTPTVDATTVTSVSLSWGASTDNQGVTSYEISRNGSVAETVVGTSFVDTGLQPNTAYDYSVVALDAAGNRSSAAGPVATTTPADTTAPSVPVPTVTSLDSTSVTLGWPAVADDVGVVEYVIYESASEVGRTSSTSFTHTGLAVDTTYRYTVEALDAAGNTSALSSEVEATTTVQVVNLDLVSSGALWSYLDDGSDQGTAWSTPGFDDGAWDSGASQLGFGDGDEATVLESGHITYYFRHELNPPGTIVGDATIRYKRDDAIAIYVNGTLVESNALPATWNHTTRATTTIAGGAENTWVTIVVPQSHFVAGTNVLAVEIHQRGPGSSDITFDLELSADVQLAGGAAAALPW